MDYTVHGILQARILEWIAFPFSRGSSNQGSNPHLSHCRQIPCQLSHKESPRILEGVAYPFSSRSSQELNWGLPHCRRILYQLGYEGSPWSVFVWGWGESAIDCKRVQKNCWQSCSLTWAPLPRGGAPTPILSCPALLPFFFFFKESVCFVFGCAGSLLLCVGFLWLQQSWGATL